MIEELFRFVITRPPSPADAERVIPLDDPTPLFEERDGRRLPAAAGALTPDQVPQVDMLREIRRRLLDLGEGEQSPLARLQATLGGDLAPDLLVGRAQWRDARVRLSAAVIAGKFQRGSAARRHLQALVDLRRTMATVELLARNGTASREQVRERLLSAPLLLPGAPGLAPAPIPGLQPRDQPALGRDRAVIDEMTAKIDKLRQSRDELLSISPNMLDASEVTDTENAAGRGFRFGGALPTAARWLGVVPRTIATTPTAVLRDHLRRGLKRGAVRQLSPDTQATLNQINVDAETTNPSEVHARLLREERAVVLKREEALHSMGAATADLRIGAGVLPGTAPVAYRMMAMAPQPVPMAGPGPAPVPAPPPIPAVLPVRAAGVAELLLVRQRLSGYERVDLSHIENVLPGETRKREHRRRQLLEETFTREEERERSEERDLQSTDRYELQQEASETVKEELQAKGELKVTAKYGPYVEVEASGSIASSTSRERSSQTAQTFAKDVTQRTAVRVAERVRETRTRRLVEEVEESNLHAFENAAGNPPIAGLYQFLDKLYEARVYNYGLRTLYDFVVPEPAAFYIAAFEQANGPAQPRLSRPLPFSVEPQSLTETNYDLYVARYGAQDVTAPPRGFRTVGWAHTAVVDGDWEDRTVVHHGEISVPDGYEATRVAVTVSMAGKEGEGNVDVAVGDHLFTLTWTRGTRTATFSPARGGTIPVSLATFRLSSVSVAVSVECRRTAQVFEQWQIDTHERLVAAHDRRLTDYHAELDRIAAQAVQRLAGRNPALNRRLEAQELKRAAITILSQGPLTFDAIDIDPFGIPQVDVVAARQQDPLIRFLEQAFEWETLTYVFYPYFWGRTEPHWKRKLLFEDVDPFFADFIRAGAARVILPVRPGFETVVDHYCTTGEPWGGGDLPEIGDDLYVPIIDEQMRQLGAPGNEVPVGNPWEVRVPTTLVMLRSDSRLPRWGEVAGRWTELPPPGNGGP